MSRIGTNCANGSKVGKAFLTLVLWICLLAVGGNDAFPVGASVALAGTSEGVAAGEGEQQPGEITGRLLYASGEPASEQQVLCLMYGRWLHSGRSVKTDQQGHFGFDSLPSGEYVLAYGPLLKQGRRVTVHADAPTDVTCRLEPVPTAAVRGHIKGADAALTDGYVFFIPMEPDRSRFAWPPPIWTSRVGANGEYSIDVVEPGRYLVHVRPSWEAQQKQARKDFFVTATLEPGQTTFDMDVPSSSLRGTIRSPDGDPVGGLMVLLSPSELGIGWNCYVPYHMSALAWTEDDGTFVYNHITPGRYDLVVRQVRASEETGFTGVQVLADVVVQEGGNDVQWQLEQPSRIRIRMNSGTVGSRAPYAMALSQDHPKLRSVSDHLFRPEYGECIPHLLFPPGRYKLFLMDAHDTRYAVDAKEVVVSDDTVEVGSSLEPAGGLKVVLRSDEQPVDGRTVRLWSSDGTELLRLYDPLWYYDYDLLQAVVLPTAPDGITTIGNLRPGEYRVSVPGTTASATVTVRAGETVTVEIPLD